MFRLGRMHQTAARSSASETLSHMQSWADCITGTHESSFWKRQGGRNANAKRTTNQRLLAQCSRTNDAGSCGGNRRGDYLALLCLVTRRPRPAAIAIWNVVADAALNPVEAVSTPRSIPQAGGAYQGLPFSIVVAPFHFPKINRHRKDEAPASVNVPRLVFHQGEL